MSAGDISTHFDPSNLLGLVTQVAPAVLNMRMVASNTKGSEKAIAEAYVGKYVLVEASGSETMAVLGQISEVLADKRASDGVNLLASRATIKLVTTIDLSLIHI